MNLDVQIAKEELQIITELKAKSPPVPIAAAPSTSKTKEKGVKRKQNQVDPEKRKLAQSKIYWVPTVQTAIASTAEGSEGSSEQIQEKLIALTAELQDLNEEFDENLNSAIMQGKKPEVKVAWQQYFDKYNKVKRNILALQLKVERVDLEALEELKTNWRYSQLTYNGKSCAKTLEKEESTAFETGKAHKWAERYKECIDLKMEVMKLEGQIEQVEPVSEELKRLIEKMRDHQSTYEEEFALGMPKKALDSIFYRYTAQKTYFKVILSKVERVYKEELAELKLKLEPIEEKKRYENWGKKQRGNKTPAELETLDREISKSRVQNMKEEVETLQKKVELVTKLEAKVSTSRVALAAGISQTEEAKTSQAKKRRKSTETSPAKKHKS